VHSTLWCNLCNCHLSPARLHALAIGEAVVTMLGMENMRTPERVPRIKDPELMKEWKEHERRMNEAIGEWASNSFRFAFRTITWPVVMPLKVLLIPRRVEVKGKDEHGNTIKETKLHWDPPGQFVKYTGESLRYMLHAWKGLGLTIGRASTLAVRKRLAI